MNTVRSQFLSIACHAGERVITNHDLAKIMDTTDEWVVKRTGIRERRFVKEGTHWTDMVLPAALKALADAEITPEEVDMIITGTLSGDLDMPSAACVLQARMGAKNASAFNLQAACSGFLFGVTVADRFIRCEPDMKVLVVGADVVSSLIDLEDRATAVLFGDGGGAAVLSGNTSGDGRGILASRIYSDGTMGGALYLVDGAGASQKYGYDTPEDNHRYRSIHMRGNEIFKVAIHSMERASLEVLEEVGMTLEEVDIVIPHQANIRIIQTLASRLGVEMEDVFVNVDRYGNTSAGTIPLALAEAVEAGRVKRGDVVLMPVFGGGLTWGVTLMRW